ncbi:MAG: hypothetical protein C0625_02995 [Arcobacter sp.]|nr:MAG: hypothetical protein C0625_02995 [Arcobacter sp.]
MKKSNYRIVTIITYLIISVLAVSMTSKYLITKEQELLSKKYDAISKNLQEKLKSLVEKKKNATLALTITLANNTDVKEIIRNKTFLNNKLNKLSLLLRKETDFKNVWFHVIDNKGFSVFRSWSEKKNDNLLKVRKDIKDMVQEPKIKSTISVGKYDITFKAMVPIYVDNKFIGIIESITHFNSITRGLRISNKLEPIIVLEEKFTEQLKYPFTKLFVDNHYIANISANKEILKYMNDYGIKKIVNSDEYIVNSKYLIIKYPLYFDNIKLATFVLFKDLKFIDSISIEEYKKNVFYYLGLFIILLGLILYVISYYLYSREITKLYNRLNKNQEELKKLNESLKQTVEDEIAKNDRKNKIMFHQSKQAAMGEMIGNIAHQWRQPLSIITTAASGIKLKKELDILERKEEFEILESIIDSANYLSNTIDDFRDFFSPNKEKKLFNTEYLFNKVMNLIEKEFSNKDIYIIKEISSCKIASYENELLQVIINLLNNSRDELINRNDLENKYVFLKSYKTNTKFVIEIKDNAGGINEKIIDRIFEPYFTTKHQSQGTGIGLYMSDEIISKHMNGNISVKNLEYEYKSEIYFGACFKIEIPIE